MKSLVLQRIFNVENFVEEDGVRTKRDVPRSLAKAEALDRFEPLPLVVDHADGGIRNVEHTFGQSRKPVIALFGGGIENVESVKGFDSAGLIGGDGRCLHVVAPETLT